MRKTDLLFFGLLLIPASAGAQVRASEAASVSQTIDGTKITINYSRPRVRGRQQLFGGEVKWGEVWTPGANSATTIEFNKDIKINDHPLKQGKYSMWFVVHEHGDWTAVFDSNAARFHTFRPDTNKAVLRFPVAVQAGPPTTVLTFAFNELRVTGGTLTFQWETRRIDFNIQVPPSITLTTTAADARPYLGHYSVLPVEGKNPKARDFTVLMAHDTLKAEWDRKDVGDGMQDLLVDYFGRFVLVSTGPDWFVPVILDKQGEIYEVLKPEMTFEFARENGQIKSFAIRDEKDKLWATGTRKN